MKKNLMIALLCIASLLLSACGDKAQQHPESAAMYSASNIDLNLAGMSSTFIYSQVYNIMGEPADYLGKVIRIEGYYSPCEIPETGMVYHACIIPDATSCCAQGIEFVWAGNHAYPADYREEGTGLTVTGRLETYLEDGYTYLHLVDAEVIWNTEKL